MSGRCVSLLAWMSPNGTLQYGCGVPDALFSLSVLLRCQEAGISQTDFRSDVLIPICGEMEGTPMKAAKRVMFQNH